VTAPEPLTLAELVRHLGEHDYWLGYDPSGMYVAMPMDNDSPVRCGTGSTPWEAANDAMPGRQVAPRDDEAAEPKPIGWGDVSDEDELLRVIAVELKRQLAEAQAEANALRGELQHIADADPSQWDEEVRDSFREWAQSRARAALAASEGQP